jgi:hypothetical protein
VATGAVHERSISLYLPTPARFVGGGIVRVVIAPKEAGVEYEPLISVSIVKLYVVFWLRSVMRFVVRPAPSV